MPRTRTLLAAPLTVLGLLGGVLVATSPASADPGRPGGDATGGGHHARVARAALADAAAALHRRTTPRRDLTTTLTRLRLGLDALSPAERGRATRLLARPTDPVDPDGQSYSVTEAPPVCGAVFCVHYTATTADAPPAVDANANGVPDQVDKTLALMDSVYDREVVQLGYRAPATDGTRGGDGRFDVYLKDISSQGLYGYCAPEDKAAPHWRYDGYCVLDNDFVGFPGTPDDSLVVTAAHEFFHAIQFNYDASEDAWMMEATATWMEERYADAVNDNLQFVPASQIRRTRVPLDYFDQGGASEYGNFVFFELLSERYGDDIVRTVWERADSGKGAPDDWSTKAVNVALRRQGSSLREFYARFAGSNTRPRAFYQEGGAYRKAPAVKVRLRKHRRLQARYQLDHLTNRNVRLLPQGFKRGRLHLRFRVPGRAAGGGVAVTTVARDGSTRLKVVRLDRHGRGHATVPFGRKRVDSVTVSLANGSLRTKCWQNTSYACQGEPRDDDRWFAFTARS